MEEMRDGRMDGSKDGWKVVRLALRGGTGRAGSLRGPNKGGTPRLEDPPYRL